MLMYLNIFTITVNKNANAQLLAVLPLFAKNKPAKFTPAQFAYHRVRHQHLTNILIKLADLNDKNIEFDGDEPFVLHLRRTPL